MRSPIVLNTLYHMKEIEMAKYEVPQVEIIEVEVEKGFAASDGVGTDDDPIG